MSSVSLRKDGPTVTANEAGREFWRAVLLAGGFTAIPRWTLDPVSGVGEHVVRINPPPKALRRLANDLGVPLSSLLLAAHARVLGALSREREVCTGYAVESGSPLPCRMTIGRRTWREVVLEAARSESDLLRHKDHPLDDLRRELGLTEPLFETVFELGAGGGGGSTMIPCCGSPSWNMTGLRCASATERMFWTRVAPPGSPATTSARSH